MKNKGYDVVNYIDDVIGFVTVTTATPSYSALFKLLQELGFDISTKTLVKPCTKAICGVEIDARTSQHQSQKKNLKILKKYANVGKIKQNVAKRSSNLY